MGILKKRLLIIGSIIILFTMILLCNGNKISVKTINERQNPVKAAVLLYRFDDVYTSLVRQGFEEIQKNNPGIIEFTFYDGKNDQGIQNQTIDTLLESKSAGSKTITVVGVDAIPAAQELILFYIRTKIIS